MKTYVSIERAPEESTGKVVYMENGQKKAARFNPAWKDEKVLEFFGISKAAPEAKKDGEK